MDWFRVLFAALLINTIAGISLRCGEDIVIRRGEKKVLRFWSSEDESLNVDVLSRSKNNTETRPTGHGQEGGARVTGTTGATSSNVHPGPSSSSGVTSNRVQGTSDSNKFRIDLDTSDTDTSIEEQNDKDELYYSYNHNVTSQHGVNEISETDQEVTSTPEFDQTHIPAREELDSQSTDETNEDVTDIPSVTEITPLKINTEENSGQEKPSIQTREDENQTQDNKSTQTENIPSNTQSSQANQNISKEKIDSVLSKPNVHQSDSGKDNDAKPSENFTVSPKDNQESDTEESKTSFPNLSEDSETATNPNIFSMLGDAIHGIQEEKQPNLPEKSEENNQHMHSHSQRHPDIPHLDLADKDEDIEESSTYDPWTEQRQDQENLENALQEIVDSMLKSNDKTQNQVDKPKQTDDLLSNVHKSDNKNLATDKEKIDPHKSDNENINEKGTVHSVDNKDDEVDSTTLFPFTEQRLDQKNVNNKLTQQSYSQKHTEKLENNEPMSNINTETPDLITTVRSFISAPHKKGASDTMLLEPEGAETTTLFYRKIFDDRIGTNSELYEEHTKVPLDFMTTTTELSISSDSSKKSNPSVSNLDSSTELSTANPLNSEGNETEVPSLVNKNIHHIDNKPNNKIPHKDIFPQDTTDRLIPITDIVTGIDNEEMQKEPDITVIKNIFETSTEKPDDVTEYGTEIFINDKTTTENSLKIKIGDPLVSENILFRMDELGIMNDDSTTFETLEDSYNDEASEVTTETIYTSISHDSKEDVKKPALSNDEGDENKETNEESQTFLQDTQNLSDPQDNSLSKVITEKESVSNQMSGSNLASEILPESDVEKDHLLQETVTETSLNNLEDDEATSSTFKVTDSQVTEASIKQVANETSEIHKGNEVDHKKDDNQESQNVTDDDTSTQEYQVESDTDKTPPTGESSLTLTTAKSTPLSKPVKLHTHENTENNPVALSKNTNNESDDKFELDDNNYSQEHPNGSLTKDDSDIPSDSTTSKPTITTEFDIFASIIERWTEALEDIPDETHISIDDLAINVADFLDIDPSTSLEVTEENYGKPSIELPPEHRDPLLPPRADNIYDKGTMHRDPLLPPRVDSININDEDTIGTTQTPKDFIDQFLESHSQEIGGFMDESLTQVPEETFTTQDTSFPDDSHISIDDLAINVADFLDIDPGTSLEVTDKNYGKPSIELPPGQRDPLLPPREDNINNKDTMHRDPLLPPRADSVADKDTINTTQTEKDFIDQFLESNSQEMAGFMDEILTQVPEESFTTQDTLFSFTEPMTRIQFSTKKPELTTTQNKFIDNLKNSDQSTGIDDFFAVTEIFYQPTVENTSTFSTVTLDEVEETTMTTENYQMTDIISSTTALTSEDSSKKENSENKLRNKLDEIFEEDILYDGLQTSKPIEEPTTITSIEVITESKMEGNGATTAFTIPLVVLKNQVMLDNLLNGQSKNGGSRVVIKEQGSKVAISSPSQNDYYQTQEFTLGSQSDWSTTSLGSSAAKEQDQTTEYLDSVTTEIMYHENEKLASEEIRGTDEKVNKEVTTHRTLDQTMPNEIQHDQNVGYTTDYPTTVEDIALISSALNEYLNIENLISLKSNITSGFYENTSYPEVNDSYNNNEDTIRNTATTNIPDTSTEESTEPLFNELIHNENDIVMSHSFTTTSSPITESHLIPVSGLGDKSTHSVVKPLVSSDKTTVLTANNEDSQNMASEERHQFESFTDDYKTTTIQSETDKAINDSNFATIIIPPSIVNGLHGGHIKNNNVYPKTEASTNDESTVGPMIEDSLTELNEMGLITPTELLQNGSTFSSQHSGGISRKDDEGQTDYGGSSPFFIRLPGSPDPVPVYIQYEPVEINYVPTNGEELHTEYRESLENEDDLEITNLFRDTLGTGNLATEYEVFSTASKKNESVSNSSLDGNINVNEKDYFEINTTTSDPENDSRNEFIERIDKDNANVLSNANYHEVDEIRTQTSDQHQESVVTSNDENSDYFRPNKPILKRPDPFFVMEAPKLGSEEDDKSDHSNPSEGSNSYSKVEINQNEDRYSVDVSSQYGFASSTNKDKTHGTVEDVPLGLNREILYPGDYYLHDSYTDVNLKLLRNPVFNLRPKLNTPSPEDLLSPQYTPFPITTNPPRQKATSPITALPLVTSLMSTSAYPDNIESNLLSGPKDLTKTSNSSEKSPTTEEPPVTSQRHPPSIEYSPIPAVDFDDSYALSYNPDYLFGNEESIVAPSINQFNNNFGNQEETNNDFAAKKGQIDEGSTYSSGISPHISEGNPVPTDNLPIPSDQFMAHKQVWAFPQSREDPAYLRSDAYNPEKTDGTEYMAFHSPLDFPGIDPAYFSSRKVPAPISSQNSDPSASSWPSERHDEDQVILDLNSELSRPTYEDDFIREGGGDQETLVEGLPADQEYFHLPPSTWQGNDTLPEAQHEVVFGPQFFKYLNSLPYALLRKFLDPTTPGEGERLKRSAPGPGEQIFCEWNIRTDPGLYLLMTFHNLSATYTVDCHGAYIEVERENNGYDARWCGNRIGQAGTRPHVIFAKTEVRITVYDDGSGNKAMPTGFEADIEVIDLFNKSDYRAFMRSDAYPHIRRLLLG